MVIKRIADQAPRPTTVLVVDDDSAVRLALVMGLAIRQIDILEAANADEALHIFQTHSGAIDVAVLDIVMPDMWGHELGSRLQAIQPDLQIIYVSGHSRETLAARGVLSGHELFLAKPFQTSMLVAMLERLPTGAGSRVLSDGSAPANA